MDWLEVLRSEVLPNLMADRRLIELGMVVIAILLVLWLGGTLRIRRYSEKVLRELDESTPERMQVTHRWDGFDAKIINPTAPFRTLNVIYTTPWTINPLASLAALVNPGGQLIIRASFYDTPRAELAWMRRSVPSQAFGQDSNVSAWVHRKLEMTRGEFATRGNRVEKLSRTFNEFYIRFNTALLRVCIQQEMESQMEVVISMSSLPAETIPHLMASAWSLAQAAAPQP